MATRTRTVAGLAVFTTALCIAGAVLFGAPACNHTTASAFGPATLSPTARLINDLSIFAQGRPPPAPELKELEEKVVAGTLTLDAYIDQLLARPMGGRLAKDIVLGATSPVKDRHPIPVHSILRSYKDGDTKVYYLATKCSRDEAKSVKPWWAPEKEVLVCPSAYRPDVMGDKEGRTCGASMLAPRDIDTCGCGPWLMYCTESHEQFTHTQDRVQQEVIETASYVVDSNLPIEKLFTMNETVRNNDTELLYRRARIAAGEDADKLFPVTGYGDFKGKLMPRTEQVPGQAAGVLSTPALTYSSDALRGVMRNYFDYLWCTGVQSSRVSTQSVLNLDIVDLRVGDGWKKLASMNICTDCHARLDYGMQFFWGYPSSTMGVDFRPAMALKGAGPMYGHNIKDERGTADLTPAGFAKLVTSQPEFGDCMTRRVVDHVFAGTESRKDYAAVHDAFDEKHTIKDMMRIAMRRFAHRSDGKGNKGGDDAADPKSAPDGKDDAVTASALAPGAPGTGDKIALTPALQKLLKKNCKECHDKDDELNYMVTELPRSTLLSMIDAVGFGAMPKNAEGIDEPERRAFVNELASLLYPRGDDRNVVVDYFADGMRAEPVHRYNSSMAAVNAAAVATQDKPKEKQPKGFRPSSIETAVSTLSYSPGVAISSAVTALHACKELGLKDSMLAHCVEQASAPEAVFTNLETH